jgi:UPF0176 protein
MNTLNGSTVADFLRPDTPFFISSFYQFIKVANPSQAKVRLEEKARELQVLGLLILGHEGFNTTCSTQSAESLEAWKSFIKTEFGLKSLNDKDSQSTKPPFLRFSIKIREEIVTTGRTDLHLDSALQNQNHHLSPADWDKMMSDPDTVIIDTRNWYEYKVGTFEGALNPNIEKFTEFPKYFAEQSISPDKKIMIFCTGGIRCEKGILELQEKGFQNVYQLEGGILNYLKQRPHQKFKGECFVFDNRVAVDQNLQPSQTYTLCPHCGQPAHTKKTCVRCDSEYQICSACVEIDLKKDMCSKNCTFQWNRHKKKGAQQLAPYTQIVKKFKSLKT